MILDYKEENIFIESNRYSKLPFNEEEFKFLESSTRFAHKNLFIRIGSQYKINFVGEIITPENKFFSLPKNFEINEENVVLIKSVLKDYKIVSGKSLITNNTFIISKSGEVKSEKFYYQELKSYFLDFITYEFIYPKKAVKTHSSNPVSGGKIDIFSTLRNRKKMGPGITYKVKDVKNTEGWNLDDIYWSVIDYLASKYNDRNEVDEMKDFLESEGYKIKTIDISDSKKMIADINKCDVGIIHNPIKNTLLAYFETTTVSESYKINTFYTDNFAFVWEEICRHALSEDKEFRKELEYKFFRKETRRKWFPNESELNSFVGGNRIKVVNKEELKTGIRLEYEIDVKSIPDIFSEYNNKRFIGDAKYYQDPENADFEKEFRTYNTLTNNEYPMVVFTPSKRTKVLHVRQEGDLELVIFSISVEDAISDAIKKENKIIEKVQQFLYDKGYTRRI
jgi:hypothetical protein